MSAQNNAPVIIKRKKVIKAAGHHGGAWKVAYADFVTAMMAFFMLMWLLNATTEKQRKGIADYFSPTIPLSRVSGGGDGSFGGDSVFSEETLAHNGTGASANKAASGDAARGISGVDPDAEEAGKDQASFAAVDDALSGMSGESMSANEDLRHIVTRVTDEGLIVEIFDIAGAPLFEGNSDTPAPVLQTLSKILVRVFGLVDNGIAVNGFTQSRPIVVANSPVWDLSSSRADRMRQLLEVDGIDRKRILRISGYADRKPAARNPMAIRNNRLEIILLRN